MARIVAIDGYLRSQIETADGWPLPPLTDEEHVVRSYRRKKRRRREKRKAQELAALSPPPVPKLVKGKKLA